MLVPAFDVPALPAPIMADDEIDAWRQFAGWGDRFGCTPLLRLAADDEDDDRLADPEARTVRPARPGTFLLKGHAIGRSAQRARNLRRVRKNGRFEANPAVTLGWNELTFTSTACRNP